MDKMNIPRNTNANRKNLLSSIRGKKFHFNNSEYEDRRLYLKGTRNCIV